MGKRRGITWIILGLALAVGLACNLAATPAPTVEVRRTATPAATATATLPPPTETPSPSPTPDPCPPPSDVTPPARTGALADQGEALRAYLDAGGDPARFPLNEEEGFLQADLTGDGLGETVVVLKDLETPSIVPVGMLVVLTCRNGGVVTLYQYEPGEWFGLELIGAQDLTQDGAADLVFTEVTCGAHTCWSTPRVWSWHESGFENQMGAEFSYPYAEFDLHADRLVAVSGGIGSVGAGPQRPVTTTLAWTGTVITATQMSPAPPTYRYHAWLDAERALAAQGAEASLALYERTITDETLEAWGAAGEPAREHAWLQDLARWRLVMLHAKLGHEAERAAHAEALLGNEPGSATYPVTVLAERFQREYERSGDVAGACAYAIGAETQMVLDFLNSFGYANPTYEPGDLCRLGE